MLHSGVTVIQHIYDTHFAGVEEVAADAAAVGRALAGLVDPATCTPGSPSGSTSSCAAPIEWRDQINTYFFRKSGVPDAHGRRIY